LKNISNICSKLFWTISILLLLLVLMFFF